MQEMAKLHEIFKWSLNVSRFLYFFVHMQLIKMQMTMMGKKADLEKYAREATRKKWLLFNHPIRSFDSTASNQSEVALQRISQSGEVLQRVGPLLLRNVY